ncbi:MAG: AbrB/MazE/SpoVT family DNA-binding domain-containing protein [Candidatus Aenigmarchaeota archaeon]|nr:AbrB/MazE/SpoVT family DNA-binding domain-containing protein [Candidatus Aenigmarchaeota archaeon]
MSISKITRNFQVTLPRDVREIKDLNVGDKVLFVVEGERVDLVKLDKNVVKAAAGLWTGMKETGVDYERRIRTGWRKRQVK